MEVFSKHCLFFSHYRTKPKEIREQDHTTNGQPANNFHRVVRGQQTPGASYIHFYPIDDPVKRSSSTPSATGIV